MEENFSYRVYEKRKKRNVISLIIAIILLLISVIIFATYLDFSPSNHIKKEDINYDDYGL